MSDDRFPWLTEGAPVRIVGGRRLGDISRPSHATPAVVKRITKRDVVVEVARSEGESRGPERRFRRSDLTEYGARDAWSAPTRICDPDDPVVVEVREWRAEQSLLARIDNYFSAWRKGTDDEEEALLAAEAAISLLQEWVDTKRKSTHE